MKSISTLLLIFALFNVRSAMAQERACAYSEDQLEQVLRVLPKSKRRLDYPVVKDVFKGRDYKPDWDSQNADPTPWDLTPDSFPDERAIRRAGGVCGFIKSSKERTCLLRLRGGQGAWIFVYDRDATGKYVRSSVITPQTWYGIASVALVDLFGTGKTNFILIEHQGDSGTGFDERIHWLLGWHDGAFRTVLRETVFSEVASLGENTIYLMNYRLIRGKLPRIEARCSFDRVFETAYPYDFHSYWEDWLFWDEKTFSFYSAGIESEKIKHGARTDNQFAFRLNVEANRRRILKLPPLPPKLWDFDAVEEYWNTIGCEHPWQGGKP